MQRLPAALIAEPHDTDDEDDRSSVEYTYHEWPLLRLLVPCRGLLAFGPCEPHKGGLLEKVYLERVV